MKNVIHVAKTCFSGRKTCESVRQDLGERKKERETTISAVNAEEIWKEGRRWRQERSKGCGERERGSRGRGQSDLAAGKTSAQRLSVGSLSSTNQHPRATHKHIHTAMYCGIHTHNTQWLRTYADTPRRQRTEVVQRGKKKKQAEKPPGQSLFLHLSPSLSRFPN